MKSWPLILVLLLVGLSAFIVLKPDAQSSTDVSMATGVEEDPVPTLGDAAPGSRTDAASLDAGGRTSMDVDATDAALATREPNALPFTRPAAHLALQLVDGEGEGIPDGLVKVHLMQHGTKVPDIDFDNWKDHSELHTDEAGQLEVAVPSSIGLRLVIHGSHWNGTSRTVQALSAGEAVDLGEIALSPANRVFGTVKDPSGNPVAKARVSMQEANGSMWGNFGHKQVFTDEEGQYEFGGVRRGRYEIKAQAQGFAPVRLDAQEIDQAVGDFELNLELAQGEQTRGIVLDDDGNPVADAKVYLVTFDQPMWFGDYKPPLPDSDPAATSDQDGRFTVAGIADEGNLYLGAKAEGFGTGYAEEVKANGDAIIRLPRYYSLKGKVVDGKGNPLEKAQIHLSAVEKDAQDSGSRSATSKEDGSFELPASPPGSYMVSLDSPFGELEAQPVQLGPDTEALELVLPVQNPLNILLVDTDGNALAGVEVSLGSQGQGHDQDMLALMELGYSGNIMFDGNFNGQSGTSVTTDAEGLARFADLEPKRYQLSAELLGYALLEEDLDVSGVPQQEEYTMVQGGILRVRLVDDAGQPVANVPVGLRTSDEGDDLRQQDTDSAGRAIWNNLEEGEYLVSYRANDANGWWWDNDSEDELAPDQPRVEVRAGEVKDFELLVGDLALLTVVVTRGGLPAPDVKVHLKEVQEDNRNRYYSGNQQGHPTDGRGEIELPAVQPGNFDIIVKGRKSSPATEERVELHLGPQTIEVNLDGGEVKGSLSGTNGPLSGATVALVPHFAEGSEDGHRRGGITVISYATSGGKPSLKFGKSGEEETNTRSDQQGKYHFTDVPDGEWTVVARSEGFGTWTSQPLVMRGGRMVDLGDYRLFPGAVIQGHDLNFVPQENEQDMGFFRWGDSVRLETPSGEMITMSMIDEQGEYLIEDLPEGEYLLRKDKWKSEPIHLSAGEQALIDIPLEEPEEEEEAKKEQ